MSYVKLPVILVFAFIFIEACNNAPPPSSVPVAENKSYAASLFRQNCAICHGPDATGKTLEDGKVIPSLRSGQFKFKTDEQIYNQIANGGNGMVAFRNQLTDREIKMLVDLVQHDFRKMP